MFLFVRTMRRVAKIVLMALAVFLLVYALNSHFGDRSNEATRLRDFAHKLKQKVGNDDHGLHEGKGLTDFYHLYVGMIWAFIGRPQEMPKKPLVFC